MEMRKGYGKLWKLLLPAMLLAMLLGMSAMAAGTQVVTMTSIGNNMYMYANRDADAGTTYYHRIDIPASGALSVTGNVSGAIVHPASAYSGVRAATVSLCNSKLQPVDARSYANVNAQTGSMETYGVKKGTYYIKLSGNTNYAIAAEYTKWTDKGGSSKKKAKSFKLGKTVKGVMAAGEAKSKADWFKVKVSKKKQLQISIKAQSDGPIYFKVYGPSYKKGYLVDYLEDDGGVYKTVTGGGKKLKVKPGTYYIKVYRGSYYARANGIYSIKCSLK